MSSDKKDRAAASSGAAAKKSWLDALGPAGRKPDAKPPSASFSRPRPDLSRYRPVVTTPGMARFEIPGSRTEIGEISGDPRLADRTVADAAANTIGMKWLDRKVTLAPARMRMPGIARRPLRRGIERAGRAEWKARRAAETATAPARKRYAAFAGGAMASFHRDVMGKRTQAVEESAATSLEMMSRSKTFRELARKKSVSGDFKLDLAGKYEEAKAGLAPADRKDGPTPRQLFIARMENMAPDMRGGMYFNVSGQDKILRAGGLFAKQTRRGLGMGEESHTPKADEDLLGNHDHVFFMVEHRDSPMRPTRFASESTLSGEAGGHVDLKEVQPGDRRISLPLASLMRRGTWAMRQDFLKKEKIGKDLPVSENVVASADPDPHLAARHFMRQFALSALDNPALKKGAQPKNTAIQQYLDKSDEGFASSVFHHLLRPQLMVPSAVNLQTRGAFLDMPLGDWQAQEQKAPAARPARPSAASIRRPAMSLFGAADLKDAVRPKNAVIAGDSKKLAEMKYAPQIKPPILPPYRGHTSISQLRGRGPGRGGMAGRGMARRADRKGGGGPGEP